MLIDLLAVAEAIRVAVTVEGIGAEREHLLAVAEPVTVCVWVVGVGAKRQLIGVVEPVAVRVEDLNLTVTVVVQAVGELLRAQVDRVVGVVAVGAAVAVVVLAVAVGVVV